MQPNDPYSFITNPQAAGRRPAGGGSMKTRLIVAGIGATILVIIAVIFVSVLGNGGGGLKEDYQTLLKQQTELIRISEIGNDKARQADAKNLAITTGLSVSGQQKALLSIAKKAGAKTDDKSLALGKNVETDSKLNTADQTNRFDEEFIKTVKSQLADYQQMLKKIYDQTTKKTTKDILNKDYSDISILLGKTP